MVKVVLHTRTCFPCVRSGKQIALAQGQRLNPLLLRGLLAGKEVHPAQPYSWDMGTACAWLRLESVRCFKVPSFSRQ